jgi:hypothetical protein
MRTYSPSLAVVLCSLLIAAAELRAANLPVKQVTLYKHGIGFFEREGAIPAGEEARLDFKNTDMNDVLKSLTVSDTAGGHISGIRYDSNESLAQQLEKYPFTIGNGELLSAFLDGIKGARLEVRTGDRAVTGTILGARPLSVGAETGRRTLGEQLTLLLDSSDVTNFDLAAPARPALARSTQAISPDPGASQIARQAQYLYRFGGVRQSWLAPVVHHAGGYLEIFLPAEPASRQPHARRLGDCRQHHG